VVSQVYNYPRALARPYSSTKPSIFQTPLASGATAPGSVRVPTLLPGKLTDYISQLFERGLLKLATVRHEPSATAGPIVLVSICC
jgi:hypothetical protein